MIAVLIVWLILLVAEAPVSNDALLVALALGALSDSVRSNRMSARSVLIEDIKARIGRESK